MSDSLYRIGCSGYYYPTWKNKFYPEGVQPKDWLSYYSTVFNTVELNGTFYRVPRVTSLLKYAQVTSDDFRFSVKVNQHITHILKLKNCKQEIQDFIDLIKEGLGSKCAHILFQMPPSFQYSEENLERVITNIPHDYANVVEFRHASWWNEKVQKVFSDAKLTFCNVDFPGLDTHFVESSPHFYLRLHGSPELFKSSYSISQLDDFYKQFPVSAETHSIYFNNTYYEAGYTNALQLIDITDSVIA